MKTKEELKELKKEYETLAAKLQELTEDELVLVTGGDTFGFVIDGNNNIYEKHFYHDGNPRSTTFEPRIKQ